MDKSESRNKPLILIIGLLMLSNIILLTVFVLNKSKDKKNDKPQNAMLEYLKTDLQFTPEQIVQYDTLRAQHRRTMRALYDSLRAKKQMVFKDLGTVQFADSNLRAASEFSISEYKQIELQNLQHIKNIRSIGTPLQQQQFDTGYYKIMMRPRK